MKKIIIDTDIGDDIDDAFALLTALSEPELEILGITTVFKNTPQRAQIVRYLLRLAGKETIPVYAGIEVPLNGLIEKWNYEQYQEDGKIRIHHYLDEMASEKYAPGNAVDFILETAAKYPGEVTLVALGPFMNVAAAKKKDNERFALLKEAYIMGGQPMDTYPEWNVRVDPLSASEFFSSGLPITCVGLNVTVSCKLYDKQIECLNKFTSPAVAAVRNMMRVWIESNNPKTGFGNKRYPTMHDPLCVLSLAYDDICQFEDMHISVKENGITVREKEGSKMRMAVLIDLEKFYERFFGALKRLEEKQTRRKIV